MEDLPQDLFHALAHWLLPAEIHILALTRTMGSWLKTHWYQRLWILSKSHGALHPLPNDLHYLVVNEPMRAHWRLTHCRRLLE